MSKQSATSSTDIGQALKPEASESMDPKMQIVHNYEFSASVFKASIDNLNAQIVSRVSSEVPPNLWTWITMLDLMSKQVASVQQLSGYEKNKKLQGRSARAWNSKARNIGNTMRRLPSIKDLLSHFSAGRRMIQDIGRAVGTAMVTLVKASRMWRSCLAAWRNLLPYSSQDFGERQVSDMEDWYDALTAAERNFYADSPGIFPVFQEQVLSYTSGRADIAVNSVRNPQVDSFMTLPSDVHSDVHPIKTLTHGTSADETDPRGKDIYRVPIGVTPPNWTPGGMTPMADASTSGAGQQSRTSHTRLNGDSTWGVTMWGNTPPIGAEFKPFTLDEASLSVPPTLQSTQKDGVPHAKLWPQ
ncbi:hypothetical protein QFC21_002506 [Naganishia friedmannii]|uniref:Uncharacterized protein n=1 Tax=Naganishia friedmannii TaxID=89922 RepID=A0ACC2VVJ4_9TREE|nr:hypothetical protein QFC21_002506 [Naganishia friedmannii]